MIAKAFKIVISLLLVVSTIHFVSCDMIENATKDKNSKNWIAEVNGEKLSIEKLENDITGYTNKADSILLAESYLEDWIVSHLMYDKARKKQPNKAEIEQMVKDYKRSLYVHELEKQILNNEKVSIISDEEIQVFYKNFKSQNPLVQPIFKIELLIFNDGQEGLRKFEQGWRKDKAIVIDEYKPLATFFQLDTSKWFSEDAIVGVLPSGFPKRKLEQKGYFKSKTNDKISYLRIYNRLERGEEPPLSYIRGRIEKIIRHQRQRETLVRYKEDLYKEALVNKAVKLLRKK